MARRATQRWLRDRRHAPPRDATLAPTDARTRLRQRGERDEPAAVALAVGVEQLGVTGRAQAWVLDALRVDARLRQQLLVRPPEVEHHAAVRGGAAPAFPARVAEGARELADHRLADLVAARTDRRRDHRAPAGG